MKSIPPHSLLLVAFSVSAFDTARVLQRGNLHRRGYCDVLCRHEDRLPPRRSVAENFDFSSTAGWEAYYQRQTSDSLTEWHSSVPMETLACLVPSNAASVVLVGCGSSVLPEFIHKHRPRAGLILQDSSETCLQILRERYGSSMNYVCGDATKLSECLNLDEDNDDGVTVDVIYDKGLMDAIFCNEGWNTPIQLLVEEASKVLVEGGSYILVSYRLPKPTQEFLRGAGNANNLEWSFDLEGSNDRVGISVATKRGSVRP